MSGLRMLALAALLFGPSAAAPAMAATAQCIPAARFATLARITDGGMAQLADLIGLPGKIPPTDACRSILLSGALTRGSAAALLTEISRNKGWLATVYIAVADGDLREEIEIARLMRDFRLAGQVVAGPGAYMPDFLVPPRTIPASVSNSWPEQEQAGETPLTISFKDYLENTDRKIRPQTMCGAACWTILSGAIERGVLGTARPDAGGEQPQTSQDAKIRDSARRDFGPTVALVKHARGYSPIPKIADHAGVDRGEIDAQCKPAIDFAATLGTEIAEVADRFAKKRFPFMKLLPLQQKVRRFAEASGNAQLCVRKVMTRLRLAAFATRCAPSCEDRLKEVENAAEQALARYGASTQGGPVRAGANASAVPTPVPAATASPTPAAPAPPALPSADDDEVAPAGTAPVVMRRPQRRR